MSAPAYEPARCVVCGTASDAEIASADAVRAEVEALWAFHDRRLLPGTPPRRLMDRVAFSEHPPLRLVRCTGCGLVYRNPIEREYELAEIYGDDAPAPDVLRSLHALQRPAYDAQARRLLRVLGRRGAGLEVGSYVGAFLAAARAVGLQVEGLDINADVNRFARALGFAVHDGDLERFAADGGAGASRTYDAVAIWNTFDQLPHPRAAVHAAWRLLRPGGVLAIRVPNGEFYATLRASAAGTRSGPARMIARTLLAHNNLLTFPYRYGFTPRSLTQLLAQTGFAVRELHGDVLVPIADEFTRRWARVEERVVKAMLGVLARRSPGSAPWIEVYATRGQD